MGIFDFLTGGSAGTQAVNSSQWSDLQNQMANYQYDPNNPNAWQNMQDQAAQYQAQTADVGSAGGGFLSKLGGAASALGSGKGSTDKPFPAATTTGYAPGASSTYHQGAPYSGLGTGLQTAQNLMKWKGLLGL